MAPAPPGRCSFWPLPSLGLRPYAALVQTSATMLRPMQENRRPTDAVVIFAKAPVPGQVKTRLGRALGDDAAARLAEAFLLDVLESARSLRDQLVVIAFSPPSSEPWFRSHVGACHLVPQPQASFGERVIAALGEAHRLGAERTVIVGMDSPHLGTERWEDAFTALDDHDACVGPCEDGGYYLLGLRAPRPGMFEDIPWGGPKVLAATRARAAALGLSLAELEADFDVDEVEDLGRLAARLEHDAAACPHTRAALEAAGIQ